MNKKHCSLTILAVLILAVSMGLTVKAANRVTLKKECTIDNKKGDVQVGQGYLFSQQGENLNLLKPDGTPIKDAVGLKIVRDNADNVYKLYRKGKLAAECAIYREDGQVIVPFGPAVVEALNEYFWTGSYAKDVTKDKKKALIYSTPNDFSIMPQEGDTLFTGEKKAFDAMTGKEVKNVKVTSPAARIEAVEDSLYVRDENGKAVIYDKNGNTLEQDASRYSTSGSFYKTSKNGKDLILDSKLNILFETEDPVAGMVESKDYLTYRADKYPVLVNKNGKTLFKYPEKGSLDVLFCESNTPDKNIPELFVFTASEKKGTSYPQTLLSAKGEVVNKTTYSNITYAGAGLIKGRRTDGKQEIYDIMDEKGRIIVKDIKNLSSFMIASKDGKTSGEKEYYIYDKKAYALTLKEASEVGPYLLGVKDDKTGKYGVYDVISGQHLLKEDYDGIGYIYGRIYALKDGIFEVYSLNR